MENISTLLQSFDLAAKFMDCNIHGEHVEAMLNGKCRVCRDDTLRREEQERLEKIILERQIEANIPKLFRKATLENYLPQNEKAAQILETMKKYDFKRNLVLVGRVGNGKTHLACGAANKALAEGITVYYTPYYEMTNLKIHERAKFKQVLESQILIIDEYGIQASDWNSSLLFEVVNSRYQNELPTIILSNLDLAKFKQSVSDALFSRLRYNSIVEGTDWDDYRLKLKNGVR